MPRTNQAIVVIVQNGRKGQELGAKTIVALEDPYVSGKRIDLSAATGIGGNTSVKTSLSGEPVYQYTTDSLNYSGDLPVVVVAPRLDQ